MDSRRGAEADQGISRTGNCQADPWPRSRAQARRSTDLERAVPAPSITMHSCRYPTPPTSSRPRRGENRAVKRTRVDRPGKSASAAGSPGPPRAGRVRASRRAPTAPRSRNRSHVQQRFDGEAGLKAEAGSARPGKPISAGVAILRRESVAGAQDSHQRLKFKRGQSPPVCLPRRRPLAYMRVRVESADTARAPL